VKSILFVLLSKESYICTPSSKDAVNLFKYTIQCINTIKFNYVTLKKMNLRHHFQGRESSIACLVIQ
jgi:hypothetical protein